LDGPSTKFALIRFSTWPSVPEVEAQLVTRDRLQCLRAVEALVDLVTNRIRAPVEDRDLLCFVPVDPGHIFLRVFENEALHTFDGLILCSSRNEAIRLARKWIFTYPQDELDAHTTSLEVRDALTTGDSVIVNSGKFEVEFKIINFQF
jgi:hypothetical protein